MSKPGRFGRCGGKEPLLDFLGGAELLRGVAEGRFGLVPPRPLDGVADRSDQQVVVDLALDQVILGPGLHGLDGRRLVVIAREHHDRHVAGMGVHGDEGLQALAVGQREIQEDDIEGEFAEPLQAGGEQFHVAQFERSVPAVAQQVAHDPNVVRIILDQEDVDALAFGLGTARFHSIWPSR